jgi:hypothetical protein
MATTFAAFVAEIQGEANDTSTFLKTLIEKWINRSHHQICAMRDWAFLLVEKSDSTSIAVAAMPFDTDTIKVATVTTPAKRILGMMDTTDGNEYALVFTTMDELRDNFPSYVTQTGTPQYWFYQNQKVNVFPGLSDTRTFVFSFTKKSKTYATASADALLIPDENLDVLQHKVMEKVWKFKTDERAATAKDDYEDALKALIKSDSGRTKLQYSSNKSQISRIPSLVTVP